MCCATFTAHLVLRPRGAMRSSAYACVSYPNLTACVSVQELYSWRFMQTDPNWGNFLYDAPSGRIGLIDFGATRDFPPPFVRDYLHMVRACSDGDRAEILRRSVSLGFLTGASPSGYPQPASHACMLVRLWLCMRTAAGVCASLQAPVPWVFHL
jgi:ABC1 atypical kinase-like domain